MALDLDLVDQVINRPHVIDLREDGWTIMHPPACHPNLFDCSVNRAAHGMDDPGLRGKYECELNFDDEFAIGEPIDDAPGIDWNALVAELRAAREAMATAQTALSMMCAHNLCGACQDAVARALRQINTAAYDKVGEVRDGR